MNNVDNKDPWLVFCDLDGTLLKNNGISIHEFNIRAIKEFVKRGNIFVIMTGRPPRAAKKFYHQLELNTLMGTYNGAYIYRPNDDFSLGGHVRIDKDVAEKIINEPFIRKNSRSILIETPNAAPLMYKISSFIYESYFLGSSTMGALTLKDNNKEKWSLQENPITIGIETMEDIEENEYNVILNKYIDKIFYTQWHKKGLKSMIINVTNHDAHKKNSCKIIAEHYGMPQERIMCFGDGENDFEMFSWAGHPVKMKDHAAGLNPFSNTTKYSNNDGGVGHYLNDFFKLNIK